MKGSMDSNNTIRYLENVFLWNLELGTRLPSTFPMLKVYTKSNIRLQFGTKLVHKIMKPSIDRVRGPLEFNVGPDVFAENVAKHLPNIYY